MVTEAIKKIKEEMKQNSNDQSISVIGEFLIQHLNHNPEAAENVLVEGKSIVKSIDEMASVAKKKASKGRAMLTDQEGFEIVLKYFGIKGKPTAVKIDLEAKPTPEVKTPAKSKVIDFNVSLEDFIK